jgi:hypothetical protein
LQRQGIQALLRFAHCAQMARIGLRARVGIEVEQRIHRQQGRLATQLLVLLGRRGGPEA